MSSKFLKKINIALVGLGFGNVFFAIYRAHPNVGKVIVYDPNIKLMEKVTNSLGNVEIASSFEEILNNEKIDAVHLVTPIPLHAEQTIAVLQAGKHCGCTVPMATTLHDLYRITDAVKKSGKNYMMMETTLYTYQFMHVSNMIKNGEIGKIQFLRGSHYQDMERWPDYWWGFPPMWYSTHAISPMRALANARIKRVVCFGSGSMREELTQKYGNPYPIESALFEFENGLKGEATRSLFETAREYQEGMFVYGSKASFEWGFLDASAPYVTRFVNTEENHRGNGLQVEQIELPNYYKGLPKELWAFTIGEKYNSSYPVESLKKGMGGGHHGSHPHLVHEFISSIVEKRKPYINEDIGANITAAGICAHESAMKDGESIMIPSF